MKQTNLEKFCDKLNWQGGTIHDVSQELAKYVSSKELIKVDSLLKMNNAAIDLIFTIYDVNKSKGLKV
jgi:hypothetical protein